MPKPINQQDVEREKTSLRERLQALVADHGVPNVLTMVAEVLTLHGHVVESDLIEEAAHISKVCYPHLYPEQP